VRVGVVIPTYDSYGNAGVIRRLIGAAEVLGYDSVWFGDHLIVPGYAVRQTDPHWYEAMSCAILGMGMTSRLSFGTDVLVAPYRNPILLAKMAAMFEMVERHGIKKNSASIRGATRKRSGPMPIASIASTSSDTCIVPNSAVNAAPTRAASMMPVRRGPSSRVKPIATNPGTSRSVPKRCN